MFPPYNEGFQNYFLGPNGYRGTRQQEKATYWVVYVAGIYELTAHEFDNDPDGEFAWPGGTHVPEPNFSVIAQEVIRDYGDQWSWNATELVVAQQVITLHEATHQFDIGSADHSQPDALGNPQDVMWVPRNEPEEVKIPDVPLRFADRHLDKIRRGGGLGYP